jgi:hypothetical protein
MSISGNKSYSNSNTSGSNQFKQLTDQIDVNTTNIAINTADILINSNNIASNTADILTNTVNIATNTNALTGISYIPTPTPTTQIINNLNISGTSTLSQTNVTGELLLIDDVDTSKQMKIHWFAPGNGYWFESMNNSAYIYFIVKDAVGNVRAVQFNYNQLFTSVPFFCNASFTMDNAPFIQGTDSTSIQFIASPNPWDGWRFTVTQNNYYANWYCRNSGGTDINVFRLHSTKISSLIDHEFIGNIIVASTTLTPTELSYLSGITSNIQTQLNNRLLLSGGTITGNLQVNGTFRAVGYTTLGLTTINGVAYNYDWTFFYKDIIFAHSATKLILTTPNTSLTQTELSYLSGISSNIQTQLNNKLSLSGGTLSGNLTIMDIIFANSTAKIVLNTPSLNISQTELSYLSTVSSNIQTQLNNKLDLTGGTLTGN